MTLEEIIYEVMEVGVKSAVTDQRARQYINRAQRWVCDKWNFTWMFNRVQVTIPSGYTSTKLDANFKQLNNEQSPVSFQYGPYPLPVVVTSRAKIESYGIFPWLETQFTYPLPGGYLPIRVVFLEQDGPGGQWTFNIPPQYSITGPAVFNVSAFWYPSPLEQGSDSNAMTLDGDLQDALINRAKAIAYNAEEVDNPKGAAAQALAEASLTRAKYADSERRFGGRQCYM